MNGILIIDKPDGITSHDVVARVRRILKTKRVGHTGTLDPFATGVMVMLIGQATRVAQFLDKDVKEYEALVRFGFETDTGDRTGVRRRTSGMRNADIAGLIGRTDWDSLFSSFRGEIEQVPPMYSAKKVDGKKLYEHARKGEVIERNAVKVTIHKLEIMRGKKIQTPHSALRIQVVCSAGTYIRTLAEDIGRQVGAAAHLTELRRTRAGKFGIDDSLTLQQLEQLGDPSSALIAMDEAVSHLHKIPLPDDRVEKTKNGLSTLAIDAKFNDGEALQMVDGNGQLIAIGFYDEAENIIQPKVVLV